jgi:hypothetical protein
MVSMTLDLTTKYEKLYTALGIDREKDGTLLGYTQKYLSHPGYPFILMGVKSLMAGYYDSFVAFQYFAILSQYRCKDFMDYNYSHVSLVPKKSNILNSDKRPIENLDSIAFDSIVDNGKTINRLSNQTTSSDLTILAHKLSMLNLWKIDYSVNELVENPSSKLLDAISGQELVYSKVSKVLNEILFHLHDLIVYLKSLGYWDQDFEWYINEYENIKDSLILNKVWFYFLGKSPGTHNMLLNIYESIGVWFDLKKLDNIGMEYSYAIPYYGEIIYGVLDQRHHYCQLNDMEEFGGLLIPTYNKKTGETTLEIGQIIGSRYT